MSDTEQAAGNACTVGLECRGAIAHVTLSSDSGLNLLTAATLGELEAVCRQLREDAQTRAVLVVSSGRHFCGGLDLDAHRDAISSDRSLQSRRRLAERGARAIDALMAVPQPTVCAVNGVAAGGGACIAAACDFRIAGQSARLGFPEVLRGMNLGWHSIGPCVRLVGPARAKRMIMLGGLHDPDTLAAWGFLDEIAPDGELERQATALAQQLAALPPVAVQMIKKSINAVSGALDAAIMHMDADQFLLATASGDSREAIAAFLDKRLPSYRGD